MSLKLGRFFDINLYIHWSFWLLPLWILFTHGGDPEVGSLTVRFALLGALFSCVVLHEYGHALAARTFGIATRDVTLYPIGGVARLERMSEKPWEEFWIAVAGPVVNLVIAAVLGFGLFAVEVVQPAILRGELGEFLFLVLGMNIVLFVFNLMPAFPMDGGRVLRSLLAIPLGRLQATRIAVYVSAGMAVLFSLVGVLYLHNPWLMLIGLFLIFAGQQELRLLEAREQQDADHEAPTDDAAPGWRDTGWRDTGWRNAGGRNAGWRSADAYGTPSTTVTVYIWDPRKHAWILQGVIPPAGDSRFR